MADPIDLHPGQPVPLTRYRSHADEYDALAGKNDADYVDYLSRLRNGLTAYQYLEKRLAGMVQQADFTPAVVLRTLLHEARALARGYGVHNAQSGTCDCRETQTEMFRGACVGCGAGLAPEARARRREVSGDAS